MYTVPQIPGVKLEVYKEDRLLIPESDGFVGQLYSGSTTILAIIDGSADKTVGFFRDGKDHYIQQKDWLIDPASLVSPQSQEKQQRRREFLGVREFDLDTKVYGVAIPLHVFTHERPARCTVNYPENTLGLAQYVSDAGRLTGRVHVWEVAVVSQNGNFFLTIHRHYNIPACRSIKGPTCFPRLQGHYQLEQVLVRNIPGNVPLTPAEDLLPAERDADQKVMNRLGRNEGIVKNWYAPRNMGAILTSQGPARVHWTEMLGRPRYRYLKEGERIKFAELREPQVNPKTAYRKMRVSGFELQAYGVEVQER